MARTEQGPQNAAPRDQDTRGADAETVSLKRADLLLLQNAAAEQLKTANELALLREKYQIAMDNDARASEFLRETKQQAALHKQSLEDAERRAAAAEQRAGALAEQAQRDTELIAQLRQQVLGAMTPTGAQELAEVPAGMRRVITLQPYSYDGEGRQPKMVPKETVMVVPEKDYQMDLLRKFPHLLDYAEHLKRKAASAEREAQPVNHSREALNQVLDQVDTVIALRRQQQAETAKLLLRPEVLAGQLSQ